MSVKKLESVPERREGGVTAGGNRVPAVRQAQIPAISSRNDTPSRPTGSDRHTIPPEKMEQILAIADEALFVWDIRKDQLSWTPNAHKVLGVADPAAISTNSGYGFYIDPEHAPGRYNAIVNASEHDSGRGVGYRLQYRFMPRGRRDDTAIWLEEHGRWYSGRDGRPAGARGVVRIITERHEQEQHLLFLSAHDELTGQMNRANLNEAIADALMRAQDGGTSAGFLLAGVSNLTQINETFGFEIADEVIAAVGRRLRSRLRDPDIIGRYSSNKFGIVINECGPQALASAANRLMSAVRDRVIETAAGPVSATISVGGVLMPRHAENIEQATGRALEALDQAKTRTHDSFFAYEPSSKRDSWRKRNLNIADEIIRALGDGRMVLALQPIVSTRDLKPDLYECLLRMQKPDGTIISAGDFIPFVEKLGLSRLIDLRVLELAVKTAKASPDKTLSFNVSGLTANDTEWLNSLRLLVSRDADLASRLIVEITETAAIGDIEESIKFVQAVKKLGCRVAIDDFGAGYTSFRNLKLLGVDMVKIDGSFIKNILVNKEDQILVKMLSDLARSFGLACVAEWVEDQAVADYLCGIGITHMQGYHFGKPRIFVPEAPVRDDRASEALPCSDIPTGHQPTDREKNRRLA